MTTVRIPGFAQAALAPRSNARNGRFPTASFAKATIDLANQSVFFRTKEVARFFAPISAIPDSGGAGERNRWNSAFHSSPFVFRLWAVITLAQNTAGGVRSPFARIRCSNIALTTIGDATVFGGATLVDEVPLNIDTPAFFTTLVVPFVDATDGSFITFPQDTDLTLAFSDFDDARMVSAMIYEEADPADTANGYPDPGVAALGPILDSTREALATRMGAQWKAGAAHLFNWSNDNAGSAPSTSGEDATPTNVIDGTSTTVSTATPGFTIDLSNMTRRSSTASGVKVTMYVLAKETAAATGIVRLVDSGGAVLGSVTGFTASFTWRSTTFFLPASAAKYDLHMVGTISQIMTVSAVSVYAYEA